MLVMIINNNVWNDEGERDEDESGTGGVHWAGRKYVKSVAHRNDALLGAFKVLPTRQSPKSNFFH